MSCHRNNQAVLTDMEHDVNLTGTLTRTLPGHGSYTSLCTSTEKKVTLISQDAVHFSRPNSSPITKDANLGIFSTLAAVFIQVTHTCVVRPRMICRCSNTDREVRFSGQDWISRNPENSKVYSQGSWVKPKNVTLIFPLPVISWTVLKYSSFAGFIGGIL